MIVKVKLNDLNEIRVFDVEAKKYYIEIDGLVHKKDIDHLHDLQSLMQVSWGEVIYMNAGTTHPKEKAKPKEEG